MKHCQRPRTIYRKYLGNRYLAKVRNIEDVPPIFGYVGQVRLDSLHERTNSGSAIPENFFPYSVFALNFVMQLLKIIAIFQEFVPKYYFKLVTPDSEVIKPSAVRKDKRFKTLGVVRGAKTAHDTVRSEDPFDVEMLYSRCGMSLVNFAYLPSRNVCVCLSERRKFVEREIPVVGQSVATDCRERCGSQGRDRIPKGMVNLAAKGVTLGMKVEGDARDGSHFGDTSMS